MMPLIAVVVLLGQIPSFSADFERITIRNEEADTARGRVYYVSSVRVYYDVRYPVRQRVSSLLREVTLYYPDDSLAYIYETGARGVAVVDRQLGFIDESGAVMSALGFELASAYVRNDTGIEVWRPGSAKKSEVDRVIFGRVDGIRVSGEVVLTGGKPGARFSNSRHVPLGTTQFPTLQVLEGYHGDGSPTRWETSYSKIDTASAFLDSLGRFDVPSGLTRERLKWR